MATTEKVVYLHAAAKKRKQEETQRNRALWRGALKYKALCLMDRMRHHLVFSLRTLMLGTGRLGVRSGRFIIHVVCNIGSLVCMFYVARGLYDSFPYGLLAFFMALGGVPVLQYIKLTVDRLLRRAPEGSVFHLGNHNPYR